MLGKAINKYKVISRNTLYEILLHILRQILITWREEWSLLQWGLAAADWPRRASSRTCPRCRLKRCKAGQCSTGRKPDSLWCTGEVGMDSRHSWNVTMCVSFFYKFADGIAEGGFDNTYGKVGLYLLLARAVWEKCEGVPDGWVVFSLSFLDKCVGWGDCW